MPWDKVAGNPQHEIAQDQSGILIRERRRADGVDPGEVIQPLLIDAPAERDLVRLP